jgi:predicted transcriptional regulator
MANEKQLVELTADIVTAHVASNTIAVGDIGHLVGTVHRTLAGLGAKAQKLASTKTPIVSIRASLKPDYIICLECGNKQKMLKRHLRVAHTMTPEQYRTYYGLPVSYPMTAPKYSEHRSSLAKAIGLGQLRKATGKKKPQAR